ncbi:MAG: amidohydrolase [Anaerolineae bacterium]|nr:amidohydrolase [Anaerolineae bacterium]
MTTYVWLLERAKQLEPRLRDIRRQLHRWPELGFQEFQTANLIAETLSSLGVPFRSGIGRTGIVASLGSGAPTIALRADMDALPIQEKTGLPYASQVPGVMHACGHDAHVAALLGAAMLLRDADLRGSVRLIFQPAEETVDEEGRSGADRMVEAGVLDGVDAIAASHVVVDEPVGTVLVSSGPILAATDAFQLAILGAAAHGAYPHKGIDAIVLAAQVVNAIQSIVARRIDPMEAGVITVGTISGGRKANVIADRVELTGTIRSFSPTVRRQIAESLREACELVRAQKGDYVLEISQGHPTTVNDAMLADLVQRVAVGMSLEVRPEAPSPVSEDFSLYTQHVPGVYFLVGAAQEGGPYRQAHSSRFDLDERALPIASAMLAGTALEFLASRAK